MSIENQPNTILTVYSPFAWIQELTATNTGTFITYPTAQNSIITFPNKIACSTLTEASAGTGIILENDLNMTIGKTIFTDLIAPNTATGLNIGTGLSSIINIGTTTTRTENINIGSNSSATVGQTTGNVNIMCGDGIQEGSFNVLTNSTNKGAINLGHIGTTNGGINIYSDLKVGLKLGYSAILYSGDDTRLGGYIKETYVNAVAMTINNAEQVIIGSISTLMNAGVYQLNFNARMKFTNLNPQLSLGVYTRATPAWVNGGLRGTSGALDPYLSINNRYSSTAVGHTITVSLSGILVLSGKLRVACVLGNTDNNTMSISTTDTFLSVTRVG
jgi:hypothetical protein